MFTAIPNIALKHVACLRCGHGPGTLHYLMWMEPYEEDGKEGLRRACEFSCSSCGKFETRPLFSFDAMVELELLWGAENMLEGFVELFKQSMTEDLIKDDMKNGMSYEEAWTKHYVRIEPSENAETPGS